jgi:hypothetical protein
MYVLTEIDPVATIRAEVRRALSRPLAIRLWHALMRAWREVSNA